jgi:dolichol-phosphate mannosyltransferase
LPRAPELSVVIPTFNEAENVRPLLCLLEAALAGIAWEAVFVDDDSPDGTAALLRGIAREDARVRCVQRIGRRGLSSAVIEGMLASSAPYLAVIDADMQHDETRLPDMLALLLEGACDVVVGTRYAEGGGTGDWAARRVAISGLAGRLSRLVVTARLSDPMSGFFMLSRPAFERAVRHLSGQGFKVLLDLFASTPIPFRFRELPYTFRNRRHGRSKLDSAVAWDFLALLLDKLVGRAVPLRFVLFALVGAFGLLVNLAALRLALGAGAGFVAAQTLATVVAMTSNFALNNVVTYRDRRLRSWRMVLGLLSFYAVCGIGAVANVGIATAVFREHYTWWVSGLAGGLVGVVWNYAASSALTWRR